MRGNTGRKPWQAGKPGEIYQKWETPGGNGRLERSGVFLVNMNRSAEKCGLVEIVSQDVVTIYINLNTNCYNFKFLNPP